MLALTRAILRAFVADRVAVVLTFVAPIAFFTLFALFYRHLESQDGFKFDIAVVDRAHNADSRAFVETLLESGLDHLRIRELTAQETPPANVLAVIELQPDFSRQAPRAAMRAQAHLPGVSDAASQLVQLTAFRAFAPPTPAVTVTPDMHAGMLLRGSAAGTALIFVLFSAASIAARGLGDDATGLPERLRSLRVSHGALVVARICAMTVIAWCQLALTMFWAWCVFGVQPESLGALAASITLGAAACTSFVALVADLAGNRTRFAAIGPVAILVVSAISGSMIPRVLLPDAVARTGSWTFPAWAIDASSAAIEGHWDLKHLALLAGFVGVCTLAAMMNLRGAAR